MTCFFQFYIPCQLEKSKNKGQRTSLSILWWRNSLQSSDLRPRWSSLISRCTSTSPDTSGQFFQGFQPVILLIRFLQQNFQKTLFSFTLRNKCLFSGETKLKKTLMISIFFPHAQKDAFSRRKILSISHQLIICDRSFQKTCFLLLHSFLFVSGGDPFRINKYVFICLPIEAKF